jgi:hypothetical protein
MRQRLQQKLQERADRISQPFPPRGTAIGSASKKKTHPGEEWRLDKGAVLSVFAAVLHFFHEVTGTI